MGFFGSLKFKIINLNYLLIHVHIACSGVCKNMNNMSPNPAFKLRSARGCASSQPIAYIFTQVGMLLARLAASKAAEAKSDLRIEISDPNTYGTRVSMYIYYLRATQVYKR